MMQFNEQLLREHYAHLSDKPFFGSIVDYMTSHPVLLVVLTGKNAVSNVRKMVGATDPNLAENRTIRKDFGRDKTHNVIHASDSIEGAELEIDRFFSKNELVAYVS
jgi:nucleoside-diphosphate kinase